MSLIAGKIFDDRLWRCETEAGLERSYKISVPRRYIRERVVAVGVGHSCRRAAFDCYLYARHAIAIAVFYFAGDGEASRRAGKDHGLISAHIGKVFIRIGEQKTRLVRSDVVIAARGQVGEGE